jgi:hypothetical protein
MSHPNEDRLPGVLRGGPGAERIGEYVRQAANPPVAVCTSDAVCLGRGRRPILLLANIDRFSAQEIGYGPNLLDLG